MIIFLCSSYFPDLKCEVLYMKKLMLLAFAGLFFSNALLEAGCKGGSCSRRPKSIVVKDKPKS